MSARRYRPSLAVATPTAAMATRRARRVSGALRRAARAFCYGLAVLTTSAAWGVQSCEDDPTLNTLQINECLSRKHKTADEELNRLYRSVLAELSTRAEDGDEPSRAARDALILGQRAWVRFRDGECGARYDFFIEGTLRNPTALSCKIELTEDRIKTIRWWLEVLAQ